MEWFVQLLKDGMSMLAENAPIVFALVAMMILVYIIYSRGVSSNEKTFDKAVNEINKAHQNAHKNSQDTIVELYKLLQKK